MPDGPREEMASIDPPRLLVIGAGSRGNAYAKAVMEGSHGTIAAVAEPVEHKRTRFGARYIWGDGEPEDGQVFDGWEAFLVWEQERRERAGKGEAVPKAVDGVLVCTLDETHAEIVNRLACLRLHVLCEKPLATTLEDCLGIYRSMLATNAIFAVGHVLRYSPHNLLLRRLLLEDKVIGDIVSVEHTEPVGWWHFAHSYVRGNWRNESVTGPSLLTKSCHDMDLLLWLLCSPPSGSTEPPHLPSNITSTGSLVYYRRSRKPAPAGEATNCLSCAAEPECMYSAKKIYHGLLASGRTGWPVKIVVPDIEDVLAGGMEAAEGALMKQLAEDYSQNTPAAEIESRPWFGRCVYEAGNTVCDDQFVTLTWNDDSPDETRLDKLKGQGHKQTRSQRTAKRATFHMVAFTESICERRSRIYGTEGEIEADSRVIRVHSFRSGETTTHHPHQAGGGHGGGDAGLARQFALAINAVKNHGSSVADAQAVHIGCTLEDVIRSHAMVFAAEDARRERKVVDWAEWWSTKVESQLGCR